MVTVLPVTTDDEGTCQVNVTVVLSGVRTTLRRETDGPGKRGVVSEEAIERERENPDWRALFKGKEQRLLSP